MSPPPIISSSADSAFIVIGEPPSLLPLIAATLAAIFAGLYTCADCALTSLSRARLRALTQESDPRFRRTLQRVSKHRERVQARYLAGRVTFLGATTGACIHLVLSRPGPNQLWLAIAMLFGVVLLLSVAATLGRRRADHVVAVSAVVMRPLEWLMAPVALLPELCSRAIPSMTSELDRQITEAEVEMLVDHGQQRGLLDEEPADIIRNALDFADLTVKQVMVRRTKVTAIRLDTPIDEVLTLISETGHSRYPVYREEIDDVFGLLYAKDLFRVVKSSWPPPGAEGAGVKRQPRLEDVIRTPIQIVRESQGLNSVLQTMRRERHHMALVVDEYGGMAGIVTLEDLLEEIVGDIQDESDLQDNPIVELEAGRLMADGGVLMADLIEYLDADVSEDKHYDSVAGMLTERLGRVPNAGTEVEAFGLNFIVRESDEKHVSKVEIMRISIA